MSVRPQRVTHQPHGTITRYAAGCSCSQCCEAHAAYAREARIGRRYVRRNYPAAVVSRRVHALLASLALAEVARRSGLGRATVRAIRDRKYKTVKSETRDAIYGVEEEATDD